MYTNTYATYAHTHTHTHTHTHSYTHSYMHMQWCLYMHPGTEVWCHRLIYALIPANNLQNVTIHFMIPSIHQNDTHRYMEALNVLVVESTTKVEAIGEEGPCKSSNGHKLNPTTSPSYPPWINARTNKSSQWDNLKNKERKTEIQQTWNRMRWIYTVYKISFN